VHGNTRIEYRIVRKCPHRPAAAGAGALAGRRLAGEPREAACGPGCACTRLAGIIRRSCRPVRGPAT